MTDLSCVQLSILCWSLRRLGLDFCNGLQFRVQARVLMACLVVLEKLSRLFSLPGNGVHDVVCGTGACV
jgi:hypothetical protein